ncbi:MAG: phosphatase PAP2 family protein [Elusimicrobia bacterium]|nr:phosphatase PAP2 family protein [Elusimicrobiota bacterium]
MKLAAPPLLREDRFLVYCNLVLLAAAFALTGVNKAFFHYTGILYFIRPLQPCVVPLAAALLYGLYVRDRRPEPAFVLVNMGFYGVTMVAQALLVTGIQYTPFPTIDAALVRWDALAGFNVLDLMAWTHRHPYFLAFMRRCYATVDVQLVAVPLIAALLRDRRTMRVFLYAMVYSFFIGCLFYYVFPSSGPASVLQSPHFSWGQRMTGQKFHAVHHFKPVETIAGGMIAFPSFHVAWGVMLPYVVRPWKALFWPVATLNALMIASTVFLGWHFLVDVPSGIGLALLSLWLGERTHRRLEQAPGGS